MREERKMKKRNLRKLLRYHGKTSFFLLSSDVLIVRIPFQVKKLRRLANESRFEFHPLAKN
jgi:hypothetical protein